MIKKVFCNRVLKNYLIMFLTMFSVELIFKAVLKMPILDWSLLRIFIANNFIALFLSFIFSFCGHKVSNILTFIICVVASIYAIAQAGFYNFLGVIVSIGTRSQLGAVKDYIKDYLDSFLPAFYLILIPLLLVIIYFIFIDRRISIAEKNKRISFADKYNTERYKMMEIEKLEKTNKKIVKIERIVAVCLCFVFCYLFYYSLSAPFMQNELQVKTNKELFVLPDMPNLAVVQFGVTSYGLIDVESVLLPKQENNNEEIIYSKPEQDITDYSRIIDDTAWETWAEETNNSSFDNLNNYYLSKPIAEKNEYTGMFKGKNLIVIMMESTNTIIMNEEYYPNITKLAKEGWYFNNAFSPRNSCSTGNNEMSGMVSLFTINNTCTANTYKNNFYPQAIFNLFNNQNYITTSYHDYEDHYYDRKVIHKGMGSSKYYNAKDLSIPYSSVYEEWPSDVLLMEKYLEKVDTTKPFMSWITSVSGHQPYTVPSELGDLHLDMFENTGYDKSLKRYMSKLKVFDDSLGTLISGLESKGVLDDTIIVLYADHYPYGLGNKTLNQYFDYDVKENNEVDRTPFIIYNPNLEPKEFEQYTSYMNILPTIANLFDLDYDPRLYSGYDVLSKDYPNRVVFADGSWQDAKAFYNATTGKISYYTDESYDVEYIKSVNTEITMNIKMANLAITSNYFEALFKGIEKNKIVEKVNEVNPDSVAIENYQDKKKEEVKTTE
ncbi:MAG: LTA synthase family protein [Bacilli bacterium]